MKSHPRGRKDNLVVQEMDGEVLIYDLTENKAYCLNETSALVWQACDGNRSTAEIAQFISQELNSPATEDLVWFAIDQLKKEKLIENSTEIPNHFGGLSRREVIKKVGLGSMVALPIVAGIVAPQAVHAQSCGSGSTANGNACTVSGNCLSCCCDTTLGVCTAAGVVANGMNANVECQCIVGSMLISGMCTA